MKLIASPVKEYAIEKNLKIFQPEKVRKNEEFIEQIKKLSSIYDPSKSESTNKASIKEKLLEINSNEYKNWNGTTTPTLNAIKKYRQYSEFKTSTFIAKDSEYEDGQIKNMYFEFSK